MIFDQAALDRQIKAAAGRIVAGKQGQATVSVTQDGWRAEVAQRWKAMTAAAYIQKSWQQRLEYGAQAGVAW